MENKILLLVLLAIGVVSNADAAERGIVSGNARGVNSCVCPENYDPVCGKNGQTYSNACQAECDQQAVDCERECPCEQTTCSCPEIYAPVCGTDGVEYGNECEGRCLRVEPQCRGHCPCPASARTERPNRGNLNNDCVCPDEYDPVCGGDGKGYPNSCHADCNGVAVDCRGPCPCVRQQTTLPSDIFRPVSVKSGCTCPEVLDPFCASNGLDYSNACLAYCAGAELECRGTCPCLPSTSTRSSLGNDQGEVCVCPKIADPVCGSDGRSYENPCRARCAGARVRCAGRCPCN